MADRKFNPGTHDLSALTPTDRAILMGAGPWRIRGLKGGAEPDRRIVVLVDQQVTKGASRGGNQQDGEAIHFLDGCRGFVLRGADVDGASGSIWHGIRARGSRDFAFEECETANCHIEGFIYGACGEVVTRKCKSHGHGQSGRHESNMCHGFYPGYSGGPYLFEECEAWDNTGIGAHNNGTADEQQVPLKAVTYRRCIFRDNGSGGIGNMDFSFVDGWLLEDCLLAGGNGGLSTWDDGAGDPRKGAKNGRIVRTTIVGGQKFIVRLEQGGIVTVEASIIAGQITQAGGSRATVTGGTLTGDAARAAIGPEFRSLREGLGWSPPGVVTPPQPQPPDPTTPTPPDLAELRHQLAAVTGERDQARAENDALRGKLVDRERRLHDIRARSEI